MTDNNAEESLRLAVSQRPDCMEPRAQLASLLSRSGRRAEALAILREGSLFALGREDRLEQLAVALMAIDALPEALEALQAACRLAPRDQRLRAQLQSLSAQLKDNATATRQLFNQYATTFDEDLKSLGYTVPQQIAAMLTPYTSRFQDGAILDLGCGTGLMGPYLRPYATQLIGIDLSCGMLDQARSKGIYDTLVEGDIADYCRRIDRKFALITAADVLVYSGDLQPLFAAVSGALVPGGLFAFTVERHEGEGFAITETKRVSHARSYIEETSKAAALAILSCDAITPRHDRGMPVEGLMVLATNRPMS